MTTLQAFLVDYCHENLLVAEYWLNVDQNTLSNLLGEDNDSTIDENLLKRVKELMDEEIPSNEVAALEMAFEDLQIRMGRFQSAAYELINN
ncbi:MAG: hypothetical protein P794_03890 [Epsilonproteobacteria bacterium (ex Lamellibrachia satsuma)]|nr:MAG: hypothetical protein P794_03890 [Epsilonproteobacteria bacterium (ex Lamellibrachia satsuma)]